MDINLIIFSISCIILISLSGFAVKMIKKKKERKDIKPEDFLKNFTALVISIGQSTLRVLSESDNCKDEKEFKNKLINIVAEELQNELLKSDANQIAKFIPKEEYIKFVSYVFEVTDKINIPKKIDKNATKKEIKSNEIDKNTTKKEIKSNKIDITDDLNKIINKG